MAKKSNDGLDLSLDDKGSSFVELPEAPAEMGTTENLPRDYQGSDGINTPDGGKQWADSGHDELFPHGYKLMDPALDPDYGDHEAREDVIYGREPGNPNMYERFADGSAGDTPEVKVRGTGEITSIGFLRRNNIKCRMT